MEIELLVVPDCPNEAVAAELITTALRDIGVQAAVSRTVIANHEQAQERGFAGSPTILVNGVDPCAEPDAPVALACRLYLGSEGLAGVPSLRELRQALQRAAAG